MSDQPDKIKAILDEARDVEAPSAEKKKSIRQALAIRIAAVSAPVAGALTQAAQQGALLTKPAATMAGAAGKTAAGALAAKWIGVAAISVAALGGIGVIAHERSVQREKAEREQTEKRAAEMLARARANHEADIARTIAAHIAADQVLPPADPAPVANVAAEIVADRSHAAHAQKVISATRAQHTDSAANEISPPAPTMNAALEALRSARAAFASGDAARTVSVLDEHQAQLQSSPLAEDAAALRALARCQVAPAERAAALANFAQNWPNSVHLARIRRACQ